jgi:cell division protease FtsH
MGWKPGAGHLCLKSERPSVTGWVVAQSNREAQRDAIVNNFGRNLALWVIVALLLVALFNLFQPSGTATRTAQQVAYSDFLNEVNAGHVRDVTIQGRTVSGQLNDGRSFSTFTPEDPQLVSRLTDKGVRVVARPEESDVNPLFQILISWFPMLLLIGVWIFFMRQMQGGGGRAMGFGKSKAKLLTEKQGRVTFDDVAGIEEAKAELEEIVEFLRDPQKFQRLGGKIPKGVLLVGPPGTGKTLLARSIAGEANVPFFTISGSDFVEMFVGVGASRVRDMFEQGKKNAPCIIFIDEIDAVGRHRGAGLGGGNDEREQTLNQMLVEMDGFESNEGVIIIAATNRPDVLDPALLRPGRFDRQVVVPNPDVNGREKILRVHMRKVPLASDVEPKTIARGTPGFSGADLANLVNEAALLAARTGRRTVGMAEFEAAKDKVMMGAERRSLVMSEDEKRMTAYHEAGHALVAMHEPECDPVHKATIIPRGRALGLVMSLPAGDRYSKHKSKMKAELAMAMGGRVAEELIFGPDKVSNGASGDIKMATDQARRMVTEWGMSENLGMIAYGSNDQEVFLGHSVTQSKNLSEETARKIDGEIRSIIDAAYARATKVLSENIDELHLLAKGLLEHETISGEEIKLIIKGEPIVRVRPDEPVNQGRGSVPSSGGRPNARPSTGPWSGQPGGAPAA